MESYKERCGIEVLHSKPDIAQYKHAIGIPDNAGLRPKCWKILLDYIPYDNRKDWPEILQKQRNVYYQFVKELIKDPSAEEIENAHKGRVEDHPLNDSSNSKWQSYFEELSILEQIDKDVRRTLPDIAFFQLPVPPSPHSPLYATRSATLNDAPAKYLSPIQTRRALFKRLDHLYKDNEFGARTHAHQHVSPTKQSASPETSPASASPVTEDALGAQRKEIPEKGDDEVGDLHWEAVERILFIFAKLNPGIGYVQGLNEILAPLYYVMANDIDEEARAHAEADSFFTFSKLVSQFRDHFIRHLDGVGSGSRKASTHSLNSGSPRMARRKASMGEKAMEQAAGNGIGSSMARLMKRLRRRDLELWKDFQLKGIDAAFFAFRWLTVLLTQEFSLPDLIRIWDSMIADLSVDIVEKSSGSPLQAAQNGDANGREGHFDFLLDFCCAMLVCKRQDLLAGSFADNVKLLQRTCQTEKLQNYPVDDINIILRQVFAFREAERARNTSDEDFEKLERADVPAQDFPPGTLFVSLLRADGEDSKKKPTGGQSSLLWADLLAPTTKARRGFPPVSVLNNALMAGLAPAKRPKVSPTAEPDSSTSPGEKASLPRAPNPTSASLAAMGGSIKKGFSGFLNQVRTTAALPDDGSRAEGGEAQPAQRAMAKGIGFMRTTFAAGTAAMNTAVGKIGTVVKEQVAAAGVPPSGAPPAGVPETKESTATDSKSREGKGGDRTPEQKDVMWARPDSSEQLAKDFEIGDVDEDEPPKAVIAEAPAVTT
ncbi:hypothetical protein HK104_006627 [Borealophlyctis nickersoniae]|nr:hypothetical protein HK104_006627 [Borealophlyctis nickersoniae]